MMPSEIKETAGDKKVECSSTLPLRPIKKIDGSWHLPKNGEEALVKELRERDSAIGVVNEAIERNNYILENGSAGKNYGKNYLSPAWIFASFLKGNKNFAGQSVWEALKALDKMIFLIDGEERSCWDLLSAVDIYGNSIDPRENFALIWDVIETPMQLPPPNPFETVAIAKKYPLVSKRWPSIRDQNFRQTVSVCYYYSRILDQAGNFFLSCRNLGKLLEVSHITAHQLLRRSVADGAISVVHSGHGTHFATRYCFNFEKVFIQL